MRAVPAEMRQTDKENKAVYDRIREGWTQAQGHGKELQRGYLLGVAAARGDDPSIGFMVLDLALALRDNGSAVPKKAEIVRRKRAHWLKPQVEEVMRQYAIDKRSTRAIAREFNTTPASIRVLMSKLGVHKR